MGQAILLVPPAGSAQESPRRPGARRSQPGLVFPRHRGTFGPGPPVRAPPSTCGRRRHCIPHRPPAWARDVEDRDLLSPRRAGGAGQPRYRGDGYKNLGHRDPLHQGTREWGIGESRCPEEASVPTAGAAYLKGNKGASGDSKMGVASGDAGPGGGLSQDAHIPVAKWTWVGPRRLPREWTRRLRRLGAA